MLRIFPALWLLCFFVLPARAQFWMQFGGSPTIDEALDAASDVPGNVYTTGYFTANANFASFPATSAGIDDIFLYKLDVAGVPQWLKQAGGPGSDKGLATDANSSGVVVTGYFSGTATFDAQSVTSAGQQDIFVAMYNTAGVIQWVVKAGGTGYDAGNGVAFDPAGNILVTGEFTGTCSFGTTSLTSAAGSIDVFTAKYNSAGTLLWVKQGSGLYTDRGLDIDADLAGNVYVSGTCSDTVTFDVTHNNSFNNAIFLIKYNAAGQEQWFRWMGSSSVAKHGGMEVSGDVIGLAGNLSGTMFFFGGTGFPSLPTTQTYNLFLCRYDTSGNYLWSRAEGSSSEVDVDGFTFFGGNGEVVAGSFKCRFSDFSATYGDGTFCSVGYWDSFVAAYDNSGNRTWARNFGSPLDDQAKSVCLQSNLRFVVVGSFEDKLVSTCNPANYLGYGTSNIQGAGQYCSDANYYRYVSKVSAGNKDAYINNNIDLSREPYDFFYRAGFSCTRDFDDICIRLTQTTGLVCDDTLHSCQPTQLYVNTNTFINRSPTWTYLWSNSSAAGFINANSSGYYWVTATSADGCFTQTDSVYFDLMPFPPLPEITDDKGVNVNSSNPQPVKVCAPDSVQLTCTNVGGNSVAWTGFPPGQNPVTITATGDYTCMVTNSAGCSRSTLVHVDVYLPLDTIGPKLICLQDTADLNDSIEVCLHDAFNIFPFDSIRNPLASPDSVIRDLTFFVWDTTGIQNIFGFSTVTSYPLAGNGFSALMVGDFDVVFNVAFVRETLCDSDTVYASLPLHVTVHPVPTLSNFPITITASDTILCPGSSVTLVASGSTNYVWTAPGGAIISHNDTVVVFAPGTYSVSSDSTLVNQYGCEATLSNGANFTLPSFPQPVLSMIPADGIACPNDSVELLCSGGGSGTFSWQGPAGAITDPDSILYATLAGSYSCVVTLSSTCTMVTNTVQVTPYNNPILIAFPTPSLCDNNPIQLTAVANLGSTIQWQPPLTGSNPVQVVSDTGTYRCDITSCGILTQVSFTVRRDTALALITSAGNPEFCSGDSIVLNANLGMAHYLWLPTGDTTLTTWVSQGGIDTLVTTSQYGCRDTATLFVNEIQNTLIAPTGTDTSVCPGLPVTLVATGVDTIFWAYTMNYTDTFYSGYTVVIPTVTTPVKYYLYTRSGLCKSGFDSAQVKVDACHDIIVPNIITPDGDHLNDSFPGSSGNYVFDLKIYNRWGNLIFDTYNSQVGWNGQNKSGQDVPDGTYYFVLDVTFPDKFMQNYKGSLMVLKGK